MSEARYDAVAGFYEAGWTDSYDDSVSMALLELIGDVDGRDVLDVACGHGRITRELARRGGEVQGVDISGRLIAAAEAAERNSPLGVRYLVADASAPGVALRGDVFDVVVCSFGLSDIDNLDGALGTVTGVLRPGGQFVFSILHPCFPGAGEVSGAWPPEGTYYEECRWSARGARSTLRSQVGANHRTLSTYVNALTCHGLRLHTLAEPAPPDDWSSAEPDAARYPVFLVAACVNNPPS